MLLLCVLLFSDSSTQLNELLLTIVSDASPNVTYVIDFIRTGISSYNANLLGFTLLAADANGGVVTPTMNPSSFSTQVSLYQLQLPQDIHEFSFVPYIDTTATVLFTVTHAFTTNSTALGSNPTSSSLLRNNQSSSVISVDAGEQVRLQLNVTAEDGLTTKSYMVFVNRFGETSTQVVSSSSTAGDSISQGEQRSSTGTFSLSKATASITPVITTVTLFVCLCVVQLLFQTTLF